MSLIGQVVRAYAIDRIARGGRRRRSRTTWGYGPPRSAARRGRSGGGFFGPVPYYSRTSRGGRSRVAVTGCCLPIPLGVLGALAAGAKLRAMR